MSTTPFFINGIGGMKVSGRRPLAGATVCLHGGPGGNSLSVYPFFPKEQILGDWYFADLPDHGRSAGSRLVLGRQRRVGLGRGPT